MTEERFHIEMTGRLLPGHSRAEALAGLGSLLKRAAQMLDGRISRLKGTFSRDKAERGAARLAALGVECRIVPAHGALFLEPIEESPPAPGAYPAGMPSMTCPKCGARQPRAAECAQCGVIIRKVAHTPPPVSRHAARRPAPLAASPHLHLWNRLFQLLLLFSVGLAVLAYWKKDALPEPGFYQQQLLAEPVQRATTLPPFDTEAQGILYTIHPVADYELNGVVVSVHDADAWWDIYHHGDWKDFLNIKDLCVIWGDNVASGVYQAMAFSNATWTCWASWPSREVGSRFVMRQLSNNHLLANDPKVQRAVMGAEPGDQVRFRGVLARYSHQGGFQRGTSTLRTDTGNGACETVFVQDFVLVQKANPGWRGLYEGARIVAILSLPGVLVMLFIAPVRRMR